MTYQLLLQYIEYKLYGTREEAHDKLVVLWADGKLTDNEFSALVDLLYPVEEQVIEEEVPNPDAGSMTLELDDEETEPVPKTIIETRTVKVETVVPIKQDTFELLRKLNAKGKFSDRKMELLRESNQLSEQQCLVLDNVVEVEEEIINTEKDVFEEEPVQEETPVDKEPVQEEIKEEEQVIPEEEIITE